MSDDNEQYQVLYLEKNGENALSEPLSKEGADARAQELDEAGYAVGSVMTVPNAAAYLRGGRPDHEVLFQVLHLRDGVERFTYAEPFGDATETAEKMAEAGVQVISIMTRDGATAYIDRLKAEDDGAQCQVPRDSIGRSLEAAGRVAERSSRLRHLAVELALEMHQGKPDPRTATEVVADARTILDFLEG